jgi:stage II sporulation protein R
MLPDYEIIRNESPQSKRSPWMELIFSLLIIQTMLFLLPSASGAAEAIPAMRFMYELYK